MHRPPRGSRSPRAGHARRRYRRDLAQAGPGRGGGGRPRRVRRSGSQSVRGGAGHPGDQPVAVRTGPGSAPVRPVATPAALCRRGSSALVRGAGYVPVARRAAVASPGRERAARYRQGRKGRRSGICRGSGESRSGPARSSRPADRRAGRRGPDQQADRRAPPPIPPDRGGSSLPDLPEARHHLSRRAARCAGRSDRNRVR